MQCRLGILVGWPDWTSQEMTSKEWCCPNPLPALLTSYVLMLQRHSLFPWPAWKLSEWLRFSFSWHVRHWCACRAVTCMFTAACISYTYRLAWWYHYRMLKLKKRSNFGGFLPPKVTWWMILVKFGMELYALALLSCALDKVCVCL